MRMIMLLGMLLAGAANAAPKGQPVLVFVHSLNTTYHTGDTISLAGVSPLLISELLYTKEPCHMPLLDTRGMHHYAQTFRRVTGCWFPTVDGGYTIMDNFGHTWHEPELVMLARAELLQDGSVKITEPNYDSDTFWRDQHARFVQAQIDALKEAVRPR